MWIDALSYQNETEELFENTKEGLNVLKKNAEDYKRFESLSKNPTLKKWLEKLYNKSCSTAFSEEWKQFETLNIWWTIQEILNKYPDLVIYVSWDLWLSLKEKNFSKLSTQQKFNFTSLYQAVNWNGLFDKKEASSSDIFNRVKRNIAANTEKINDKFKYKNLSNFLQLEKTLKEDFWLTVDESKKVKEYLELIKKHPEFVWDMKIIEAGNAWGYIVVAILALALWALWMHYIDNLWKIDPETTKNVWDVVIEEPEAILWLLTQKFGFSVDGSIEKKLFTESEENTLIEWWKNLIKRGINLFETKELTLEMVGDLALKYDLEWSSLTVNHTTWECVLKVRKPEIIIIDSRAEIINSNAEVFEMQAFRNAEMELEDNLKKKAIEEARNDPRFYEVAKLQTEQDLEELFREIKPYWIDVTKVRVEYIETLEIPRE